MGFQLPSLPSVKIPQLSLDGAVGKLTETFNPSSTVSQVTGNITSQQGSIEAVRSQLESIRQQTQQTTAAADFAALQKYTAGMGSMTDAACVMASVKPAFTPMTPDGLSNPLGSAGGGLNLPIDTSAVSAIAGGEIGRLDPLGAATGALAGNPALTQLAADQLGMDPALVNAALSGDINTLTSPDTLTSLAVTGAGMYVSGLTGGVIPPSVCSAVIDQVAGQAINGAIAGAMSGDPSAVLSAAGNINPNVQPSGIMNAVVADYSGGMLEGASAQMLSSTFDHMSGTSFSNLTATDYVNLGTTMLNSINTDGYAGMVGGINYGDAGSFVKGLAVSGMKTAAIYGDVPALWETAELLDSYDLPSHQYRQYVYDAAPMVTQTPQNIESYKEMYERVYEPIPEPVQTQPQINVLIPKQMYRQEFYDMKQALINGYQQRAPKDITVGSVVYNRASGYDYDGMIAWNSPGLQHPFAFTRNEQPVIGDTVFLMADGTEPGGTITAVTNQRTYIYGTGTVNIENVKDNDNLKPSASSIYLIINGSQYSLQDIPAVYQKYPRYMWYSNGSSVWICFDTVAYIWRYVDWGTELDLLYGIRDVIQVLEEDHKDDPFAGNSDMVNNTIVQTGGRLSEVVLGGDTARSLKVQQDTINSIKANRSASTIIDAYEIAY